MIPFEVSEQVYRVKRAVTFIQERLEASVEVAVQLGTGLGGLSSRLEPELNLPYSEIPFFPRSTVDSHEGSLLIGRLGSKRVAILSGRFHFYEGYSAREVGFPIRVCRLLGARTLILTNAAGGLNPLFVPGTIMVLRDHLNFLGENPLRGPNIDQWGPRFPDLSEPYCPRLIKTALDCGSGLGIKPLVSGVYACIPGPSLETPAETRWLRQTGADAVGMSSVPEAIIAIHGSMQVLGLSVIANVNDPDNFQPITLEEIIANAAAAQPRLAQLISAVITELQPFERTEYAT